MLQSLSMLLLPSILYPTDQMLPPRDYSWNLLLSKQLLVIIIQISPPYGPWFPFPRMVIFLDLSHMNVQEIYTLIRDMHCQRLHECTF